MTVCPQPSAGEIMQRSPYAEEKRRSRQCGTLLLRALVVLCVAFTLAVAADKMMMGKVKEVDSAGMTTVMMDDGKEMKTMMKDAKAGDAVECMMKDGKTECKKAMMKQ
jgi:hypothetical protein